MSKKAKSPRQYVGGNVTHKFIDIAQSLGIDFQDRLIGNQACGDCPFCGSERHFYINIENGCWDCKGGGCGRSGNIEMLMEQYLLIVCDKASEAAWKKLADDRGISIKTLKVWGVRREPDGHWLIPAKNKNGRVKGMYRFRPGGKAMPLKGTYLQIVGLEQLADIKRRNEPVYLCAGPWDAFAWDMILKKAGQKGIVLGIPGELTFKKEWLDYVVNRDVIFMYDNDKAGDDGSRQAAEKMKGTVKSIQYLGWSDTLPTGWDIRDAIKAGYYVLPEADRSAKQLFKAIKELIRPKHRRDKDGSSAVGKAPVPEENKPPLTPLTFDQTLDIYRKWIVFTPDLIDALKVMFATVITNRFPGPPVWMFIVGPPSSGKTALLCSLSKSEECHFESKLSPHALVSGWKANPDPSLMPRLNGKTFILKDFTEVVSMPQVTKDEIFSDLRGAYDGSLHKPFGHGVIRDYPDLHFSMLAGVTAVIHSESRAMMGERFLKFQIPEMQDHNDVEREKIYAICGKAIFNTSRNKQMDEEMHEAAIRFLLNKSPTELDAAAMLPENIFRKMCALSVLVSKFRAHPEREQFRSEAIRSRGHSESPTRLVQQLSKLAMGLALVEGKTMVDEAVYQIVERVAFDTAIGLMMDVVQAIYNLGGTKVSRRNIKSEANMPDTNLWRCLEDMELQGIVERIDSGAHAINGRADKYSLSPEILTWWEEAAVHPYHMERMSYGRRRRNQRLVSNKGRRIRPRFKLKMPDVQKIVKAAPDN